MKSPEQLVQTFRDKSYNLKQVTDAIRKRDKVWQKRVEKAKGAKAV